MSLNLQNTINFALPFVQYTPLTAGPGLEPAITIGSMVRNSMLSSPQAWYFNRNELTFTTVVGQQDYPVNNSNNDFAFIEKASLADDAGNIFEIKDVYNNSPLAMSAFQQRPSGISALIVSVVAGTQQIKFRFIGVPDKIYTVTITYQKIAPQFGPFFISSVAAASGPNTTYTGTFDPISFPVNAPATILGFQNAANNGTFVVVSCSTTQLVVANSAGVAETRQGFAANLNWDPIPDQFSDIYNNLFLSEALSSVDDARAQIYRQRGVAAYMARATGFTETQKSAFIQQWLARGVERQATAGTVALGNTGRGV